MKSTLFLSIVFSLLLPQVTLANHFYTTDPDGELAPIGGYRFELVACHVADSQLPRTVPVYRWFNQQNVQHFYTTDKNGEFAPSLGYTYEGPRFYVFSEQLPGTVPFHRWFGNGHFYSINKAEGDNAGFQYEGVLGYVTAGDSPLLTPLYRWYNGV